MTTLPIGPMLTHLECLFVRPGIYTAAATIPEILSFLNGRLQGGIGTTEEDRTELRDLLQWLSAQAGTPNESTDYFWPSALASGLQARYPHPDLFCREAEAFLAQRREQRAAHAPRTWPAIIVIRGPSSVGKTAAAHALAQLLPDSAHLQGDHWPWMSDATMETKRERDKVDGCHFFNSWLAASTTAVIRNGFHAIVDWAYTKDADLEDLVIRLGTQPRRLHIFNLSAAPEEHLRRDAARPSDARIGRGGIDYFRREDQSASSPLGIPIDATRLAPEQVARAIFDRLPPAP